MTNPTIRALAVTAAIAASVSSAFAAAREATDLARFEQAVREVTEASAASVVEVRFVQTSEFGGQTRRQDSVVLGLVVGRDGLVLVPERQLQPEFRVFDPEATGGDGTALIRLAASDFRVFVGGRAEPLGARYLTRDPDRGLAWLVLEGGSAPPGVDLDRRCELSPGQHYLGLWRLPARQGGAPVTAPGFVGGRTSAPFPALTVAGPVGPAFALDGRFCGYVVTVDVDPQGAGGRAWQENLLVDVETLARLTTRAAGSARAAPR
jgi:hypothetical protein